MTWRALCISPYHTGATGLAITSTSGYVDVEDLRFTGAAIGVSGAPIVVTVASGGAAVTGTLSATSSTHLSSTLDVAGTTTLAALWAGATSLTSTLGVAGITRLADDLIISEDAAALTHTGTTGLAITSNTGYVDVEDLRFTGAAIGVAGHPTVVTVASGGAAVTGTLSASSSAHLSSTLDVAGITTFAEHLLMLEDTTELTHTGATGLVITSTSGYVDVEDLRFTGAQIGTSKISDIITVLDAGVVINGSLSSTSFSLEGDFVVGADKFTVEASSGNTTVAGTLAVAGALTPASLGVSGAATMGTTLAVTGDFVVGADKFWVEASSGNTAVAGIFSVAGTLSAASSTDLSSTLDVAGITTLADDLIITEDAAALTHTGASGLAITSNTGFVDLEDLRFTGAAIGVSGTPTVVTVTSGGAAITGTLSATSLDVDGMTTLADDLLMTATAAALTHTAAAGATSGINITSTNGFVDVEDIRFTGEMMGTSNVPNMIHVLDEGVHVNGSLSSASFYSPMIGTSNVPDIIAISDDGIKVNGTLTSTSFAFTGREVHVDPGLTDRAWFQRVNPTLNPKP